VGQSPRHPRPARRSARTGNRALPAWKLQDAKAHFSQVEGWLTNELRPWFADRLLDVDEDVFVVWRRLVGKGKAVRHTFPQPDLFIAATAVQHDLCVVTRNAGDFVLTGALLLNPWTDTEPRPTE